MSDKLIIHFEKFEKCDKYENQFKKFAKKYGSESCKNSTQIMIKMKFKNTQSKNAKTWFFVILEAKKLIQNIAKINKILQKICAKITQFGKLQRVESVQ